MARSAAATAAARPPPHGPAARSRRARRPAARAGRGVRPRVARSRPAATPPGQAPPSGPPGGCPAPRFPPGLAPAAAPSHFPSGWRDAPFTRALRSRTGGVLDALLSGRAWIVLIGVLLVGIVFFNVDLLRMNREIAITAEKSSSLKRDNARLRQEAALLGSSERIQEAAGRLGLVLPAAGRRALPQGPSRLRRPQGRPPDRGADRGGPGAHRHHDRALARDPRGHDDTTTTTPETPVAADPTATPGAEATGATATTDPATTVTARPRRPPATTTTTTVPPG